MGRPASYSTEALVAAGVDLFAGGGARALTMSAVARATGAPSGSVYHRFPDRPALLAAVWLNTVAAFQDGYRQAVGDEPTVADAVRAAEWVVDWCRTNPGPATVLQAGERAFEPDSWTVESRRELTAFKEQQARELRALVARISRQTGLPRDQAHFVLIELPLAAVRRHLAAGEPPPPRVRTLVRDLSRAILRAD